MFFLICLVFLAFGLGMLWMGVRSRRQRAAAADWPSVEGTVLESRLHTEASYDPEDGTTTYYRPDIRYAYEVGGTPYESHRHDFRPRGLKNTDRRTAEAAVARFRAGARVPVYYDPARPEEAVLERTASGGGLLLGLGAGFTLLSLFLLWFS